MVPSDPPTISSFAGSAEAAVATVLARPVVLPASVARLPPLSSASPPVVPMLKVGVAAKAGSVPEIPNAVLAMEPIVFAPAASAGSAASDTGCVACQNAPVTG